MAKEVATWHWDEPFEIVRRTFERDGVLAIPTESSYGLGVDPRNARAVEAIYGLKGRDRGKPLPVIAADRDQVVALGVAPDRPELDLVAGIWPAPLSIVVPIRRPLPATAGEATVAVRIPSHPRLRELLRRLGSPLTASSANRSGEPPILDPSHLVAILEDRLALIIDGGVLPGGPPSTLVTWADGRPRILRRGSFPVDRIPGWTRTLQGL